MEPELVSLGGMQNSGILSGVSTFGKAEAPSRAFSGRFWPCGSPRKEEVGRVPFSCEALIFSKNHITVAGQETLKGEKFEGQIHLQRKKFMNILLGHITAKQGTEGGIQGRTSTGPFNPSVQNSP